MHAGFIEAYGALWSDTVSDTMRPVVLSVTEFIGVERIDGGDTSVVRFIAPDGREVAILVPQPAIASLKSLLDGERLQAD